MSSTIRWWRCCTASSALRPRAAMQAFRLLLAQDTPGYLHLCELLGRHAAFAERAATLTARRCCSPACSIMICCWWHPLAGWAVLLPTWIALLVLRDASPFALLSFAAETWQSVQFFVVPTPLVVWAKWGLKAWPE